MSNEGRQLFTLRQFADRHPAFTESGLRWLRTCSQPLKRKRRGNGGEAILQEVQPNGFASAFVKVGGRVLIDEEAFWNCVRRQNEAAA